MPFSKIHMPVSVEPFNPTECLALSGRSDDPIKPLPPLLLSGEADYVRMHRTEFTLLMSLKSYVAEDDLYLERKDFLRTVATRILDDLGT